MLKTLHPILKTIIEIQVEEHEVKSIKIEEKVQDGFEGYLLTIGLENDLMAHQFITKDALEDLES